MLNVKYLGDGNFTYINNDIEENTTEIVSLLKKISPRCDDYMLKCAWGSKVVNCTDVSNVVFIFYKPSCYM